MDGYLPRSKASKALNIHYHTLTKLAKNKEIETCLIKIALQF